jgi:hypothetical protein
VILIRPRCDSRCIELKHHGVSGGLRYPLFMSLRVPGGYSSVDFERIGTLSTVLECLMLKFFILDRSGNEHTGVPTGPARPLAC